MVGSVFLVLLLSCVHSVCSGGVGAKIFTAVACPSLILSALGLQCFEALSLKCVVGS